MTPSGFPTTTTQSEASAAETQSEAEWLDSLLERHLVACYSRAMAITGSSRRSEQAVEQAFRSVARTHDPRQPVDDLGRELALATVWATRSPIAFGRRAIDDATSVPIPSTAGPVTAPVPAT